MSALAELETAAFALKMVEERNMEVVVLEGDSPQGLMKAINEKHVCNGVDVTILMDILINWSNGRLKNDTWLQEMGMVLHIGWQNGL